MATKDVLKSFRKHAEEQKSNELLRVADVLEALVAELEVPAKKGSKKSDE